MKALARIDVAVGLIASLPSAATGQECQGLTGWGRFNCLSHNQPDTFVRCNELGIARGYSNMAPGRASFVMTCMIQARRGHIPSGRASGAGEKKTANVISAKSWGCGARNKNGSVRMWNEPTETKARKDALENCARTYGPCEIISCRINVATQDEAHAIWPSDHPVEHCFGHHENACQLGRRADR
jgi:hypothetical protein